MGVSAGSLQSRRLKEKSKSLKSCPDKPAAGDIICTIITSMVGAGIEA